LPQHISFFNYSIVCFIINVYSDNQQSALKYLKDTEINLNNVLIMIENFNIKDNNWNLLYLHHSTYADTLRKIADSFNLELSILVNQVPTWYVDNSQDSNLVLDLMFFYTNMEEFNNHIISPDFWSLSDYDSLLVYIIIGKETI